MERDKKRASERGIAQLKANKERRRQEREQARQEWPRFEQDKLPDLRAMLWVTQHPEHWDVIELHKHMRAWLDKDPKGFFGSMNERQVPLWDGKGPCPTCKREPEELIGPDKALETARKWMEEHAQFVKIDGSAQADSSS